MLIVTSQEAKRDCEARSSELFVEFGFTAGGSLSGTSFMLIKSQETERDREMWKSELCVDLGDKEQTSLSSELLVAAWCAVTGLDLPSLFLAFFFC